MHNLIVLTQTFPYGTGESFLENEVSFWQEFDKVYLIPCSAVDKSKKRGVPKNVSIIELQNVNQTKLHKIFVCLWAVFQNPVMDEMRELKKVGNLNTKTLKALLTFYVEATTKIKEIEEKVCQNITSADSNIFYSYWMDFHAYILFLIKKKMKDNRRSIFVSRCHGYDVYTERRVCNYIPLRKTVFECLDKVYSVSQNGRSYLIEKYPYCTRKVENSYLGTLDYGEQSYVGKTERLVVISCAWISQVKRLDRIIDALSDIDLPMKWIHLGGGEQEQKIKEEAKHKLENNPCVEYEFVGSLNNQQVIDFYQHNVCDVFVNTSESEGLPVSIMEAISFGVPIIATDVGGVKEIVESGYNGFLIENGELSAQQLKAAIEKIAGMKEQEYLQLRKNARRKWEESFCAERNYHNFVVGLIKLNNKREGT